jgi:hypothetical protein
MINQLVNQFAVFDCLSICTKLLKVFDDIAEEEIHLFSYLSCLLWLYKGNPVTEWEYRHSYTSREYPFSTDIDSAIKTLILNGYFQYSGQYQFIKITSQGKSEYEFSASLREFRVRDEFIDAACSSILTLPFGIVRKGIMQEPEIQSARNVTSLRMLLEGASTSILYEQFNALRQVVKGTPNSLLIPSTIWLTYLANSEKE